MKSKQFGFWTQERLDELWKLMTDDPRGLDPRSKTNKRIAKHFGKSRQTIIIIYCAIRKQRQYKPTTHINEKGIKVTVYAPGYAVGTTPMKSAHTSNKNQGY